MIDEIKISPKLIIVAMFIVILCALLKDYALVLLVSEFKIRVQLSLQFSAQSSSHDDTLY